jgi:L-ascorbate metabolism protein UlaG (beta-lactamase superfamily)
MKIKWFAHASFLVEGDGLRIITDPYHPAELAFPPITEPADIVIRSSSDDLGHCYAEMITGDPVVVTTTDIVETGATVRGLQITAIPVQESLIHKDAPLDNAMYRFTVEGIRVAHLGDVGNALTEEQLTGLANADVLFVLAGGPPTLDLDDLCRAIDILKPRLVIPMHYHLPGTRVKMFPVTDFTSRFPAGMVDWVNASEIELSRDTLPADTRVVVLKSSVVNHDMLNR